MERGVWGERQRIAIQSRLYTYANSVCLTPAPLHEWRGVRMKKNYYFNSLLVGSCGGVSEL